MPPEEEPYEANRGDIVDILPTSATGKDVNSPRGDVKQTLDAVLADADLEYAINEALPSDAYMGWEVVSVNPSFEVFGALLGKEIRINNQTVFVMVEVKEPQDIIPTKNPLREERRTVMAELIKLPWLPIELARKIVGMLPRDRRLRAGSRKTRKARRSRRTTRKGRR